MAELSTCLLGIDENIPKAMVPIGIHRMMWYPATYCSHSGKNDLELCPGYEQ